MSNRPQDYFGASPKTVLNRPFFHAQDQQAYNVNGGTSVADAWTTRDLNTVLHNDIQGASLSGNAVTLPAGTYYVEGYSQLRAYNGSGINAIFVNGVKSLQGNSCFGYETQTHNTPSWISGIVLLPEPGNISLKCYLGTSQINTGLGVSNSTGSIIDPSIPSIYADLKIWQLDRSLEIAPVAINSGLQTVPGLDTTGNVMGFDISKTGANELTISKGSCLDSTLLIPLAFTADVTLTIPNVANTIYHIFAVKTTGGLYEARAYTSEAAVLSDGTVDKFRWIGFVRTKSDTTIVGFTMNGDMINFHVASENHVASNIGTTYVQIDHSTTLPVSRIKEIEYGTAYVSASEYSCYASDDGTNLSFYVGGTITVTDDVNPGAWASGNFQKASIKPFSATRYFLANNAGVDILCQAVRIKR